LEIGYGRLVIANIEHQLHFPICFRISKLSPYNQTMVITLVYQIFNMHGVKVMVFTATFNNISAKLWLSVLLVVDGGETNDLPQVTETLYHIML
jgi:hypothetical protein